MTQPWRHHDPIHPHQTTRTPDGWTIQLTADGQGGWFWHTYTPDNRWHRAGAEHTAAAAEAEAMAAIRQEVAA